MALFVFPTLPTIAGSLESGDASYERCALCHGLFGVSSHPKFPHLAGQNHHYLEQQLARFLDGTRTNDGGQMQSVVTEISAAEFAVVVDWFASQESPEPTELPHETGAALFTNAGCQQCHKNDQGNGEGVPLLYSQHKAYLAKQTRDYRDGIRKTENESEKRVRLKSLSNDEIDAIAQHLASLSRMDER